MRRKKIFEPLSDTIKNTSGILTRTITETSVKSNKAIENLNQNVLEITNDKGMVAPYVASSFVNLFTPENKSQFKLMKDHNSGKMNDFLLHGNIPVTLYSNMLTFRDSIKSFKLNEDLLKTMTNCKFNVDHSNPED